MELHLLYFGIARDQTGKHDEMLDVEDQITVLEMKKNLSLKYPGLDDIESFALAVNESYADDELRLNHGDTVAVIPPVSGG